MSTTAQNYYADGRSLKKLYREFTLADDLIAKINAIPKVINNLESESATDALSANMGRVLKEMINNIEIEIDDHLDILSENPVQNKVITEALTGYALLADVNTKTFFMDWSKLPNDPDNIEVANEVVNFMNEWGKALIEYWPLTYVANKYPVESWDRRYAFYSFDTFSLSNDSILDIDVLQFVLSWWTVTDVTKTNNSILTIDSYLDAASENPVANQAIVLALAGKANITVWTTPEANPTWWDLWFNTNNGDIQYYDWTQWSSMWWWGWWGTWDVVWPNGAVDWNIVLFDWVTWKVIKDSWISLADKANLSDINVKVFYLANTSDTVNAKAAYDWYDAWNLPIIVYSWEAYIFSWSSANSIIFSSKTFSSNNNTDWAIERREVEIDKTWWVYSISTSTQTNHFLDTNTNYSSPYTPQYNGSPATKQYVDTWLATKQNVLTAWTRITIDPVTNVISADISWVMTYKWNVTDVSDLQNISNPSVWDCWYVENAQEMYAWDWTQWNNIWWTSVDLTNYFNMQTNTTDNITEWSINKFVTIAEKNAWNGKQDQIIWWQYITIWSDWRTINCDLAPYAAWNWISIVGQTIENTMPFNPGNWTTWQILRKTTNGYEWSNESSWWQVPWNWRLRIKQWSNSWDFYANQDWNTTIELDDSWSTTVNVSNTPYWTAWKNKTNTAPSQNAVYDEIEELKTTIKTPWAWVLTLKQWAETIWTFSADAKQNKTITLPNTVRFLTEDTNLWELEPWTYMVWDPTDEHPEEFTPIKLRCKTFDPLEWEYKWVHYCLAYYWAMLSVQYHWDWTWQDPRNWNYYYIIDWWYLNYWRADEQRWTYRQLTLHQTDPYQLWKVSWDLYLDFHESTAYSMILTWDVTIHFWDVDDNPNTFWATQWYVFSLLIMQDDVGWHRITFDETRVRVLKASWYAQDTTRNSISRLVLDKQEFWTCKWTFDEVRMKHQEHPWDPDYEFVDQYYFASINRYS